MAQFLTKEWLEAAHAIREEYEGKAGDPPAQVRMNLNIKECPDGVGEGRVVAAHVDSTGGEVDLDLGHLEKPEVTVTVSYDVAKSFIVEGDVSAVMQAFMSGHMVATGDISKLMAMQTGAPDPVQLEIAGKIRDITD
ncbi:SCP2 sterol-binding domain-containing protein [soil metagenome]